MYRLLCIAFCAQTICTFCVPTVSVSAADSHLHQTLRLNPIQEDRDAPVITAIAVDPRGEFLAAAGDDHVIRILKLKNWDLVKELDLHEDWVRDLQFSPDGTLLASVANDGKLLLWEREHQWRTTEKLGEAPALRAIRFSPNGNMMATVGFSPQVYLVGVQDTRQPKLTCGCRDLRTVAFRKDGRLLAVAGRSGDLHLYDAVTGSTLGDIQLHTRRVNAMVFIGDSGRTLTVSEDGHAVIYDPEQQSVIHNVHISPSKLLTTCMIGDRFAAVAGTDNKIYIMDVETGEVLSDLAGHQGSIASLAHSNGILYSGSFDTTLRTWVVTEFANSSRVAGVDAALGPDARTSRRP